MVMNDGEVKDNDNDDDHQDDHTRSSHKNQILCATTLNRPATDPRWFIQTCNGKPLNVSMCIFCQFSNSLHFCTRHTVSEKNPPGSSTWLMAIFSKTGLIKNQRLQYKHVNPSPLGSARLLFPVRKWQTANYVLFNLDGCGTPKISKTSCMAQTAKESFGQFIFFGERTALESGDCRVQCKWMSTSSRYLPNHLKHVGYEYDSKNNARPNILLETLGIKYCRTSCLLENEYRIIFTQERSYTQTRLLKDAFTHQHFYKETFSHTHTRFGTPRRERREMRWDEMRWDEMRWDEMNSVMISSCIIQRFKLIPVNKGIFGVTCW